MRTCRECGDVHDAPAAPSAHVGETRPLRVWWIPQIPGRPFLVDVGSVREGRSLLDTLARYDAFQYKEGIKPDYSNVGGLHVLDEGEWDDWYDDDGNDIDDVKYR